MPDLLALVAADRRRLVAWLAGGWTVFAVVLSLALVDLGCHGCPPGVVDPFTAQKVLMFCLVYAMAPWLLSVHVLDQSTELLAALPLTTREINHFVVLRGGLLGLACLPLWGLVLWLLPRFGFLVHPWLVSFVALGVLAYQLFGLITGVFWRVAVAAVFPLIIFPPHTYRLLAGPLHTATTPWPSLALLLMILAAWPWVMRRARPRKGRSS